MPDLVKYDIAILSEFYFLVISPTNFVYDIITWTLIRNKIDSSYCNI